MIALVQRVSAAKVCVEGKITGEIGIGLLVLLGIRQDDGPRNATKLAAKIVKLRIFPDENGRMDRSVADIDAAILVVPQFTLYGDTQSGNRPSYALSAAASVAKPLYEQFVRECRELISRVESGIFQAQMEVTLTNDGPVTLLCYSENAIDSER